MTALRHDIGDSSAALSYTISPRPHACGVERMTARSASTGSLIGYGWDVRSAEDYLSRQADAIICDIDGTLCDVRSVRHYVERPEGSTSFKPDFNRFHSESIDCLPHRAVVDLLDRARAAGYAVIIVTGREEKWSFLTSTWLSEWSITYDELLMRPTRDNRPDPVVKAAIERDIATRYRARIAVDDRPDIIAVWQRAGIATARVTPDGRLGRIEWPPGSSRLRVDWFAD
jgi:hypothetical protein